MTKTCARPYCNEPKVEHHRRGAGLCQQHSEERKRRRAYTQSLRRCLGCPNIAPHDGDYCAACQPAIDERNEIEDLKRRIAELEERQ